MSPEDRLADGWVNALSSIPVPYNSETPLQVGTVINSVLAGFIRDNVSLLGSYSGMIPGTPPIPEIVPLDEVSIMGDLLPSVPGDFDTWISDIETKLKTGMTIGSGITSPVGTVMAFPSLSIMITQSMIGDAYLSTVDNNGVVVNSSPQFECFKVIASSILDALRIGFIPSYPATLAGTGVFTVTSVKII